MFGLLEQESNGARVEQFGGGTKRVISPLSKNLEGEESKDNILILGLALRPGQAKILKAAPA